MFAFNEQRRNEAVAATIRAITSVLAAHSAPKPLMGWGYWGDAATATTRVCVCLSGEREEDCVWRG